jgi:hypothetical protein
MNSIGMVLWSTLIIKMTGDRYGDWLTFVLDPLPLNVEGETKGVTCSMDIYHLWLKNNLSKRIPVFNEFHSYLLNRQFQYSIMVIHIH